MPLFFELPPATLARLSKMFEVAEYGECGQKVFEPGDESDCFYVLIKGRIALTDMDGDLICKIDGGSLEDGFPLFGGDAFLEEFTTGTFCAKRLQGATTRTPTKMLLLRRQHYAKVNALVPEMKQRIQKFHELRYSRAALLKEARGDVEARKRVRLRAEEVADSLKLAKREEKAVRLIQIQTRARLKMQKQDRAESNMTALLANRSSSVPRPGRQAPPPKMQIDPRAKVRVAKIEDYGAAHRGAPGRWR